MSASSLNDLSSEELPRTARPAKCAVCETPASYRHFGSKPICKSCASFFRRTVALNVAYNCRTSGQCSLLIAVISAPQAKTAQTPLERLVQARKAVYINRFRQSSKLCAKLQIQPRASLTMTLKACGVAIRAEFLVVSDFLKHSGFLDILNGDAETDCPRIASAFLPTWIIYEWLFTTIRNFGHRSRRIFYIDESYFDLTEVALTEYYSTDSDIRDPWHMARLSVSYFAEALEATRKLTRARLDEVECAVLTLILFFRSTQSETCAESARLRPLIDVVFRKLALHYQQTYEDYVLRLDVIVHLADEIQRLRRLFDEHVTLLRLYGRRTMLSKIEEGLSQEPTVQPCE